MCLCVYDHNLSSDDGHAAQLLQDHGYERHTLLGSVLVRLSQLTSPEHTLGPQTFQMCNSHNLPVPDALLTVVCLPLNPLAAEHVPTDRDGVPINVASHAQVRIRPRAPYRILLYNKPEGDVSASFFFSLHIISPLLLLLPHLCLRGSLIFVQFCLRDCRCARTHARAHARPL